MTTVFKTSTVRPAETMRIAAAGHVAPDRLGQAVGGLCGALRPRNRRGVRVDRDRERSCPQLGRERHPARSSQMVGRDRDRRTREGLFTPLAPVLRHVGRPPSGTCRRGPTPPAYPPLTRATPPVRRVQDRGHGLGDSEVISTLLARRVNCRSGACGRGPHADNRGPRGKRDESTLPRRSDNSEAVSRPPRRPLGALRPLSSPGRAPHCRHRAPPTRTTPGR